MGAMLGDFGVQVANVHESGKIVEERAWAFLKRGKMIDYKHMKPQNTTLSTLIVLERLAVGHRKLEMEITRTEKELGREMDLQEFTRFPEQLHKMDIDAYEKVIRVVVYDNPYARKPLTREIFKGKFDERYGPDEGRMKRTFAGRGVQELEAMEASLKPSD